jgi:hypothetical protein
MADVCAEVAIDEPQRGAIGAATTGYI